MRRDELRQDQATGEQPGSTPVGPVAGGDGASTNGVRGSGPGADQHKEVSNKSLMKVPEVAAHLCCSRTNVYALVAQGRLRCYRVGAGNAGLRFSAKHVEDFLSGTEGSGEELKHIR